jgi:hypothetical protein
VKWLRILGNAAVAGALFAVVGNIAAGTVAVPDRWIPWVWVGTALLAAVTAGLQIRQERLAERNPHGRGLDAVAGDLVHAVRAQWAREQAWRRIHDPFPLPVQWHSVHSRLFDHKSNIRRTTATAAGGQVGTKRRAKRAGGKGNAQAVANSGELDRVVEFYRGIPSRRLVVLGKAGSGKTIVTLRLALDLLDTWSPGERVPVIFGVASWNPAKDLLWDWMIDQLIRNYPALAVPGPTGSTMAAALVETGRVLPILDGFDEIAEGLHRPALNALNGTDTPLVLTSRPAEYRAAVTATDVLTAAAGVELQDLTLRDLRGYLPRTTRRSSAGGRTNVWDRVLDRLGKPNDGAAANLAAALSTPLMVGLARNIYSDTPDYDPYSLLDSGRFKSRSDIEDHLLDALIPALYQNPSGQQRSTRHRPRRWESDRVKVWLCYLAWHLKRLRTTDMAWWELGDTIPRYTRIMVCGVLGGIATGLPLGLVAALILGWDIELSTAVVLCFPGYALIGMLGGMHSKGFRPTFVELRIRDQLSLRLGKLWKRILVGVISATPLAILLIVSGFSVPFAVEVWLLSGAGVGVGVGLVGSLETPIDLRTTVNPSSLLFTHRRHAIFNPAVSL